MVGDEVRGRRVGRPARRWPLAVGALVVAGAIAVACSSSSSEGDGAAGRPDPVGEPVDLSAPGLHRLAPPPIAERIAWGNEGPVVVWAGDALVVWGGTGGEGERASDPRRLLSDGATLSIEDGRWTPMSAAPFAEGLYLPLGAWDGEELIVIGSECEAEVPPATDGGPPACPRGPAAGAYDPAAATWRRLDPPPIPVDPDWQAQALYRGRAVGAEGAATFVFGWAADAIVWDRATESWTHVGAAFEADAGGRLDVEHCADPIEGTVVAVPTSPPGTGVRSPIRVLAPGAAAWEDPGIEVDASLSRAGFTCSDGVLVHVSNAQGDAVAQVIDLSTGRAAPGFEPTPGGVLQRPWTLGPWLFAANLTLFDPDAESPVAVRLLAGEPWSDLEGEAADAFAAPRPTTVHVPGVGLIGGMLGRSLGDDDRFLVLWRAPDDLLPG